jgi:hypothetical protein
VRYFTKTFEEPTSFWYTECNKYRPQALSSEMRRKIRRAHERCDVRRVEATWLAGKGYDCYAAAFERYENAWPMPQAKFRKTCLECADGPFEYWGAFVGSRLVGFIKCIVGPDSVALVVSKLDPEYLRYLPAYALKDAVLRTYVAEQGKTTNDGFRAIAHNTAMHDFMLQFGCRRVYCDLKLFYRPWLNAMVNALYPFKKAIDRLPGASLAWKAKVLLRQEEIRRSFEKACSA